MRAHNSKSSRARAAARLAAVQALYQRDMEGTHLPTLLDEFHRHRLGAEIEGDQYAQAEVAFFDDVVQGVYARQDEIDALLEAKLADGWTLARLDKTMHQILRAGTYELMARKDVTTGWVPLAGGACGALLALGAGWWGLRDVLRRPVVDTLRRAAE